MTKEQQVLASIRAILETLMVTSPRILEEGPEAVEANLNLAVSHVWRIVGECLIGAKVMQIEVSSGLRSTKGDLLCTGCQDSIPAGTNYTVVFMGDIPIGGYHKDCPINIVQCILEYDEDVPWNVEER